LIYLFFVCLHFFFKKYKKKKISGQIMHVLRKNKSVAEENKIYANMKKRFRRLIPVLLLLLFIVYGIIYCAQ